eukprot:GHVS01025779.1.p1 GENE.GHVS01025779.1~~GHVS01025779.1.p1  ORF type:complete len:140 (+),score=13.21 GHVS01025779.1:223-642(+)
MIQAEDRCHRIGTTHSTIHVHYLVAEETLDDTVWKTLNRKWSAMTSTLNGVAEELDVSHVAADSSPPKTSPFVVAEPSWLTTVDGPTRDAHIDPSIAGGESAEQSSERPLGKKRRVGDATAATPGSGDRTLMDYLNATS